MRSIDRTIHMVVAWLLGGMGRRDAPLAAGIVGLFSLQSLFVVMRTSTPAVAAPA